MTNDRRRSVIITFKRKDERPDRDRDKTHIVAEAVDTAIDFVDAATFAAGQVPLRPGTRRETVAYDVNQYDAPIVAASLTESEIDALRANGNVADVEDDGEVYALPSAQEAQLVVEGGPAPQAETIPTGLPQIKAPLAWDCSRGKGISVAVLDTGIDGGHPDLAPNYRGGVSFVPGETTPADGNGHGTHCAGTIAAALNGSGVVGVAPAASLYAVKVLGASGSGSWSGFIAGLDWCIDNGIRIASMSLGAPSAPTAVEAMCNSAFAQGVLLIAAAGNNGPAEGTVTAPGHYDSVVAVSALTNSNQLAEFSSWGPEVELCAPGVNVLSTLPGGSFGRLSGTSMACPHVSGAAAVAWGGHRYSDNVTIRRLLAWTSDNLGPTGRDPRFGFGRVDAAQAACTMRTPPAIPGIP
ncbi:MAG TPA: S8 family peptidase [Actinomycetota bacterium]|nr:S8 family peptidase [Actinomycetota bacterium]